MQEMLCKMPRSSTKGDVQKWNEWNFPLRAWPPKVATIPLFIHIGVNKKSKTSTIFFKPVPKYNGFILLLSSALISEYFIVKDQSLLNFSFNLTMKWNENFLRIDKILLHLKPMFEREPTESLNDDLPVLEVVGVVDGLEVARTTTVSTPHSWPGYPAVVQPGAGPQTSGTHWTLVTFSSSSTTTSSSRAIISLQTPRSLP